MTNVRLGVLARDGFCRPFDHQASGYTRAEGICVLYLQRAKHAKRIYANVVYSKCNCDGFKIEGNKKSLPHHSKNVENEFNGILTHFIQNS